MTGLSIVVSLAACDEPAQVGSGLGGAAGDPPAPVAPVSPPQPAADVDAGAPDAASLLEYDDESFVEADTNRDPFRSFARMFKVRPPEQPQRAVIMPTTSVEDMRLMAIISGVARPRAMLVDPTNVGHAVQRGDFVGRADVVQTGGPEGMPATLNWRVDRIRPNAVVLSREDPTAPNRPPLTRVLPLHEEPEQSR